MPHLKSGFILLLQPPLPSKASQLNLMRVFSFIRYAIAFYGLALEAFYPFDSLPVNISDEIKESLKSQAKDVNYFSAVVSLSFIAMFFYIIVAMSIAHGVFRLMMLRPKFRELMEKRLAERALNAQDKKKPSKRAILRSIVFNMLLSVLLVVNDIIFNRPDDALSFKEGVIARCQYLSHDAQLAFFVQFATLAAMSLLAIIFVSLTAIYRRSRQSRAVGDEESRLAPGEMTEVAVEGQKTFVLEEKLVDISDGIDGIYEKMETYVATPTVEPETKESIEEPLIKL
ncbi:hypothetical protein J3R30DRAFT_3707394 [Lentinula aciculospora]|uniref:Uncharacterized protein n=1 Tax=Lentinula aciculospora TaxID=153920 RepID=A0A9W9A4W0_9AGAR|nr:hypothetical protein J3R30DRAFT_3707394 [Lentinula aciculospora]